LVSTPISPIMVGELVRLGWAAVTVGLPAMASAGKPGRVRARVRLRRAWPRLRRADPSAQHPGLLGAWSCRSLLPIRSARHTACVAGVSPAFMTARIRSAVAEGVLPTLTPAASRAFCLAAAVPEEPETMAPA
jgi:hypothetical protein